jgi:hypothetical protein
MRLSKNEVPTAIPYPLPSGPAGDSESLGALFGASARFQGVPAPSLRATAELLDLVADRRRDLLSVLWQALRTSESTRDHAELLLDLVATCGSAGAPSPCRTALAVSEDLERLASTSGSWSHPAQVVESPDVPALYKLCAARVQVASGAERERLEKILPRLERTARLVRKAAARRNNGVARKPSLVERWL